MKLRIDGQTYHLKVTRRLQQPPDAPRLVIVGFQPNAQTREILQVCIQAIQRYTSEPHELWVVDNCSPEENTHWLLENPTLNVILNRTEPIPPAGRRLWKPEKRDFSWGSYGNAVALEIGVRLINPQTHFLMTLHQDILPCREGWLTFLQSKIQNKTAAFGVRMDTQRTPEGVLHVLGYMVDFQIFRQLKLSFFPQLPQYDVGDLVTVNLRKAGYEVAACPNTLHQPELIKILPPLFQNLHVDRALDDEGNVIFLHLGRGVRKSEGAHTTGTTPEAWVQFAKEHLLG